LDRLRGNGRSHSHLDAAPASLARQGINAPAMLRIAGMDAAAELAIRVNSQMFAASVATALRAGRAARPFHAIGQFDNLSQLCQVQAHESLNRR
jgi:hypothetical protein